jgi:hypothetical protein
MKVEKSHERIVNYTGLLVQRQLKVSLKHEFPSFSLSSSLNNFSSSKTSFLFPFQEEKMCVSEKSRENVAKQSVPSTTESKTVFL